MISYMITMSIEKKMKKYLLIFDLSFEMSSNCFLKSTFKPAILNDSFFVLCK